MDVQDIKEICQSCKYFVTSNAVLGVCKRYPQYVNKHDADWCGEHAKKLTIADITREGLKALEQIDTDVLNAPYERAMALIDEICEDKPKKRGRKPKNAETPSS